MALIKLPGLIDAHVHLRDPGQTHKEDFLTGTQSAVVGGFATILDMPNNKIPITTDKLLEKKIKIAKDKIVCDVGFYFGSLGDNLSEFKKIRKKVFGIKLYLNLTTGNFIIDEKKLIKIYKSWNGNAPILVHAEEDILNKVIKVVKKTSKQTHVCHVSTLKEFKMLIKAKEMGLPLTCGVTPHHLFLSFTDAKKLGPFGLMKPSIEKGYREFLWKNLKYVDIIESDHAPHTIKEKKAKNPPFGVPGLETTLPLLLTEVSKSRFSINRLIEMCYENPRKIFKIKADKSTYLEVDLNKQYIIDNKKLITKCEWSPFNGWKVKGKVKRVFLRGKKVYDDGNFLVKKGFGKILRPS